MALGPVPCQAGDSTSMEKCVEASAILLGGVLVSNLFLECSVAHLEEALTYRFTRYDKYHIMRISHAVAGISALAISGAFLFKTVSVVGEVLDFQ